MKRVSKTLLVLALALGLCCCLSACGSQEEEQRSLTKEDAVLYMDGLMKETYLGEYDTDFMKLVGISATEAENAYRQGLEIEADFFLQLNQIEYATNECYQRVIELYEAIYKQTRYEVVSAAQQDDGSFSVKLTIEPIDILRQVNEAWEEHMEQFHEDYPADVINTMTEAEYKEMDEVWADLVLELYESKLEDLKYCAPQSISVQIEQDEDGYYCLTDEDMARVDELVISYDLEE